jgi:hypothetical protein
VIVRVLGEGQYELADERLDELNALDAEVTTAIEGNDETSFLAALVKLLEGVRNAGRRLPDDHLGPSELVLPGSDSSLEEVRAMLGDEGLIPG